VQTKAQREVVILEKAKNHPTRLLVLTVELLLNVVALANPSFARQPARGDF